jgi:hypothetical protein
MPGDYLTDIRRHTSKPIALSETGWTHETVAPGWESSEDEQRRFVENLFTATRELEPELLLWLSLYPLGQEPSLFHGMALFRQDATPAAAWEAWTKGP